MDQLVLNYNNLTKLDAKWFKGLDNLHDLKLCNNKIARINDDAFDGLEGKLNWHFMRRLFLYIKFSSVRKCYSVIWN